MSPTRPPELLPLQKVPSRVPVIDFHSHILPGVDDGSRTVDMSLDMLRWQRRDGVDVVLATPHYYAAREDIPSFLSRRAHAWTQLRQQWRDDLPEILLGAEVAFSSTLMEQESLESLCITGTRVLLLEMPFRQWENSDLNALIELTMNRKFQVVLAHFERFWAYQRVRSVMNQMLSLPIFVQVNAQSLLGPFWQRRPLQLFRDHVAHLLGSDCHNLSSRAPNLRQGREVLEKKLGKNRLRQIDLQGAKLLGL